jgi:hypothetical protein
MLKLTKDHAELTTEDEDGWHPMGDGIIFHFKEGVSIYISTEMSEKITMSFQHLREYEKPQKP